MDIANFDIIDIGQYYEMLFYMPPGEPISGTFEAVGFETSYFIYNLGSLSITLVVILVAQIGTIVLGCLRHCHMKIMRRWQRLDQMWFWNYPIAIWIESYQIVCVCGLITLIQP